MRIFLFCLLVLCQFNIKVCSQNQSERNIPLPSQAQLEWQKKERIMFVHFGPAAFQGREYDNWSSDIRQMYLSKLNTDQWCQVAKSWGAKMIIFVAKHCGGFCWWQTDTSDYGVKAIPWKHGKGDLMKEISTSCRKYGLDLGVYLYPGDEHWGAGIGSGGKTQDPAKQEAYNKVYRKQLEELLSRYGSIKEVWFDGSCHIDVKDILDKYAPHAVYFQGMNATLRWVGNEDGFAPDPNWYTIKKKDMDTGVATALHSDKNGDAYAPVEVDVPFLNNGGHKWFWAPRTDSLLMTRRQLMDIYCNSVGRGSVLLLNSSPDTTGLIPSSHVAIYKDFGETIHRYFGKPLARTATQSSIAILKFKKAVHVNYVIIQEDLSKGQRILSYQVEGRQGNGSWKVITRGYSVGNKKIDWLEDHLWNEIRLKVLDSKAVPQITNFSAFYVPERRFRDKGAKGGEQQIGYWQSDTYSATSSKQISLDLSPYIKGIGQYEVTFQTLGYDYADNRPSGLEFTDINLKMYGQNMNSSVEHKPDSNMFRITRSQQTLDEYPTVLTMSVKSKPCKTYGVIKIRKVVY